MTITAEQRRAIRLQEAVWHLQAALARLDGEHFGALSEELEAGIADVRATMESMGARWPDERP